MSVFCGLGRLGWPSRLLEVRVAEKRSARVCRSARNRPKGRTADFAQVGHAKTVPILAYGGRRRPKDRYECCEARELFELDFVRVTEDAEITGRQVGCFDQIAEHHVSGVPEELFLISTLAEKVEVEGF